jgi:integrase
VNLYALLRVMFEVAVENDRLERSPVRKKLHRPVRAGSLSIGQKKKGLSRGEIRRVLLNVPDEYRTLFTCAAMTGLRAGELLGLRWMNVDLERGELSVTHNLWRRHLGSPKTEASARTLHLPGVLADLLAEHLRASRFNNQDDFVFARADGSPEDQDRLRKVLYETLKSVGITLGDRTGFHLFRYSAGNIVHSVTRDVKTVQSLLGHSRLSTTADIYTQVEKPVAEEASEALAKAIVSDEDIALASDKIQ